MAESYDYSDVSGEHFLWKIQVNEGLHNKRKDEKKEKRRRKSVRN